MGNRKSLGKEPPCQTTTTHSEFSKPGIESFTTTYQSNPDVHGQPTATDVFAALASDALAVDGLLVDTFADELGFEKPSQAIRAYESCRKTLDWLKNDMQLTTSEISDIAETLDNELGEVKEEVERVQAERKAKHEFEHPPVPEGFTSIEDLQARLDLGEYGDQITDCPGSIVNAFGNDYREPRLEDVDAEDLDNALSYLVNQQGHSIAEVYGNADNAFIRSVREEIDENSSEAMSELCALVRMDGQQMLDFIEKRNEAKDSLVLPKDYATMGIFNQWSGCGGMLDIQLEKDAVLPLSMVRGFQVEGKRAYRDGYTVNDTYGLVGSAWMPVHYREGTETGVKEDYNFALDKARGADAIEAHGSDEPVSLKAAVKEAREASVALAGNDTLENIGQDAR